MRQDQKEVSEELKELLQSLKLKGELDFKGYKTLLEGTYELLQRQIDEETCYSFALSVICHCSEYLPEDSFLRSILIECIGASRVFLYRDMLEEKDELIKTECPENLAEEFARDFYTLDSNITLTRDQKKLLTKFQEHKRIVVSAPTSFGKSRIITEIINHNDYSNIVIVLPTIALLTETFIRFRKDEAISKKYNLVNSLSQPIQPKNNILIYTPEKTDLFLDENKDFKVDFFVMDEIYKIQDDGDRSKVFTNALYRLSKKSSDFYLIGPYFDNFSQDFLDKTKAKFIKFNTEIVQKDVIDLTRIDQKEMVSFGKVSIKNGRKDTNLKNILNGSNEQALVYVGNKRSVESKAKMIADKFKEEVKKTDLIKYLEDKFSKDWSLVHCLKKGVAFHHAGIPKFIQSEIVDSFNNGELRVIVCSPTLIEGVNTSAKQVLIYDSVKGNAESPLTDFDVKNINGRAGRFLLHFIGRAIALIELPDSEGEKNIDFTYYDNDKMDEDSLVQVDKEDLKKKNLDRRKMIEEKLSVQDIPFSVIKQNKFIPVENQIRMINFLRSRLPFFFDGFKFKRLPSKEQFEEIILFINEYLFSDRYKDSKNPWLSDLIYNAKGYIYLDIPLKQFIDQQKRKSIDAKIRCAFNIIKNYFEFALPKYLKVYQNLFNFVCEEKGLSTKKINLDLLVMKLEYGVTEPQDIALKEAGIPIMIIKNVTHIFKGCNDINEVRERYFSNKNLINQLHPYERKIFDKYV